jgi:hypothetical protein
MILYPKDFIKNVLIDEIQDIVIRHPYLAFVLICSGIEFLGKCIDIRNQKWNWDIKYQKTNQPFDGAIKKLFPKKYHKLLTKYNLRDQLRNGLIHLYTPKNKIGLTQLKHDEKGIIKMNNHPFIKNGRVVLVIEYFYIDFVDACKKVLAMEFSRDKMNKPLLETPSK